jgi:creatinine amidohydrolase
VVLLPTIPYGTETNLAKFPLAMNLNPSTLLAMVRDLVVSLEQSGIRKLLLLNSHGGNELKPLLRELMPATNVHLFLCDWFRGLSADVQRSEFLEPGDHAGAVETALGLACFEHLVVRDPMTGRLAGDEGVTCPCRFEAVNQGWISISRPWHLLTTNSGAGNPHEATAEQGHRLLRVIVDRLADFLVELDQSVIDESFPMTPRASST